MGITEDFPLYYGLMTQGRPISPSFVPRSLPRSLPYRIRRLGAFPGLFLILVAWLVPAPAQGQSLLVLGDLYNSHTLQIRPALDQALHNLPPSDPLTIRLLQARDLRFSDPQRAVQILHALLEDTQHLQTMHPASALRIYARVFLSQIFFFQGDSTASLEQIDQASRAASGGNDSLRRGLVAIEKISLYTTLGMLEQALQTGLEGLQQFTEVQSVYLEILLAVAGVQLALNRTPEALVSLRSVQEFASLGNQPVLTALSQAALGLSHHFDRDFSRAIQAVTAARDNFLDLDLPGAAAIQDNNLAQIYEAQGTYARSITTQERAIEQLPRDLPPSLHQYMRINLANLFIRAGQYSRGYDMFEVEIPKMLTQKDFRWGFRAAEVYITARSNQGDFQQAVNMANSVLAISAVSLPGLTSDPLQGPARRNLALVYHARSRAFEAQGRYFEALDDFRRYHSLSQSSRAATTSTQLGIIREQIAATRNLTELELLQKDLEIQRLQIDRQQSIRNLLLVSLLFLGILALLITLVYLRSVRQSREFRRMSRHDFLTGLYNRRAFVEQAVSMLEQLKAGPEETYAIILADVDHFKRFNDTYGHECGDEALKWISGTLKEALRESDVLARWGGEEFIMMLPNTGLSAAEEIAQRLRKQVNRQIFTFQSHPLEITMTFGVSQRLPGQGLDQVIAHADQALYAGKQNGRNQVNSWTA